MDNKLQHFKDNGVDFIGVVYVGSNDGEEFIQCKEWGIKNLLAFEPLEAPLARLKLVHPEVKTFNVGLGSDTYITKMDITENDKASSTLPRVHTDDWKTHPVFKDWNMGQWPIVGTVDVQITRFDELSIDTSLYNILCIDAQGMELDVLKGFGKQLKDFDALSVELSEIPVYIGEASAEEVIHYLSDHGFKRTTEVSKHDDVLFVKKEQA